MYDSQQRSQGGVSLRKVIIELIVGTVFRNACNLLQTGVGMDVPYKCVKSNASVKVNRIQNQ